MAQRTALVVDDSKSARFVLKRMLNELDLEVDTAESAADALEYLKLNRPDVIFMDHMMPGMDGFEAIKRIKENAQTAIIPILMYTSKSGDVYLSQARALGAIGIIAKTITPVDLKDSLLKLGIIDEITANSPSSLHNPIDSSADKDPVELIHQQKKIVDGSSLDIYIDDLHRLIDDQTVELHKSMWLGIESVSNEIFNRLNIELEEKLDKIKPESATDNIVDAVKHARYSTRFYLVSALLLISLIVNITLYIKTNKQEEHLAYLSLKPIENMEGTLPEQTPLTGELFTGDEFILLPREQVIVYPYDERALDGNRIQLIDELVQRALASQFRGHIILHTHAGEFCLTGDETGDYQLADRLSLFSGCEYVGNKAQPDDDPSTHQSIAFANYLSELGAANEKGVFIDVVTSQREPPLVEYPAKTPELSAGAWNDVARLNNMVTIILEPAFSNEE